MIVVADSSPLIAQTLRDSAGFWISDELMALLR
jgi:hypothetical protein